MLRAHVSLQSNTVPHPLLTTVLFILMDIILLRTRWRLGCKWTAARILAFYSFLMRAIVAFHWFKHASNGVRVSLVQLCVRWRERFVPHECLPFLFWLNLARPRAARVRWLSSEYLTRASVSRYSNEKRGTMYHKIKKVYHNVPQNEKCTTMYHKMKSVPKCTTMYH